MATERPPSPGGPTPLQAPQRSSSGGGGCRRFLGATGRCFSHCGYPQRSLCCFGCSYTTRAIFIGSGGVMAGLTYFLVLVFLLICPGPDFFKGNYYLTGFLVLGIIYLPMGLTLIYSAQQRNPFMLLPWLVLNFFFVFCEVLGVILAPIFASRDIELCGKGRVALGVFILQVFIVACRCYCIAIVTHYRHKLLAAKAAERHLEVERPFTF